VFEDVSDDRRILDGTDDPHRPLTFRADQGINFVYLLKQPGPTFPESLFVSLRFEDTGDGVIQTFLLAFSPRDVAVVSVVTHHLLVPVRDVRAHGGQPFHCGEDLGCRAVLGCINDHPLLIQVPHPLLGEGRPDDIAGQVFHGRIVIRRNPVSAEDIEAGMPPCGEHVDHLCGDLSPVQEHLQNLVPENDFQLFQIQRRGDAEHPLVAVEAAVGDENVAVGIESEEVSEDLHSNDNAGDGVVLRNNRLDENLQGIPGTAAQVGQQLSIIKKPFVLPCILFHQRWAFDIQCDWRLPVSLDRKENHPYFSVNIHSIDKQDYYSYTPIVKKNDLSMRYCCKAWM